MQLMISGKGCRRFIVYAVLLMVTVAAYAQQRPLKFKHISFREGLAQSPIACLFQDNQGFIWIGNWKGLTRYDGNEFRTFKHNDSDSTSLSNNRVNGIIQDNDKNLWIATANGISVFNPQTETFRSIFNQNVKGGRNYISAVIKDRKQRIWVSTFGGVKLLRKYKLLDIESFRNSLSPDLYKGVTFTLVKDSRGLIWVGTKNGLACFDPASLKVVDLPSSIKENTVLMRARVLTIKEDKDRNIWFGTESSGVFKYEIRSGKCISYRHSEGKRESLCSDWVKDILITHDGKVWVGTRGGISVWQGGDRFLNYAHEASDAESMNDSTVWSLMQDSSFNIWVGTFAGGINLLYEGGNNFLNIGERIGDKPGLNHPLVNAVVEDEDESLWIGTYGGGINHINLTTGVYQYYSIRPHSLDRPTNGVKSLCQDKKGNLWIGTLDGLYSFNKATHAIRNYSLPMSDGKLSGNLINTILVDNSGVWAGTNGGGLRFISSEGNVKTFRQNAGDSTSLTDNFVTCIIKDDKQNLWVATQNGLNYFDTKKEKFTARFKRKKGFPLSHNTILTLLIDSKKRLWIGTEGGGLDYFDLAAGRIYTINSALGLKDDVIHSITEDRTGNIWVSTDDGLFRVSTRNPRVPFNPSFLKVTQYNANNGLASNQFSTNAGYVTRKGLMLFGGVNGLTIFNPEAISTNRYIPKTIITGFLIRGNMVPIGHKGSPLKKAVNYSEDITLNYDQRFITIKFSALSFINPANNQYAYKLEGLTTKEDWHFTGNQPLATYTNLGPGEYSFMVRSANNDGVWDRTPAILKIRVLPPWWMTWWAYLLYTLFIASIVVAVVRFFRIRAKLKRDLFYEQLQSERQQELYQMKLNFFTNVSHEIRTPLTLIVGPLEKLINTVVDSTGVHRQLIQIKNNADRLMRLVSELLDFRKIETGNMKLHFSECDVVRFTEEIFLSFQSLAMSRGIKYEISCCCDQILVCFDKGQMEKVLFNILSNAFKFTPDNGRIDVDIHKTDRNGVEWVNIVVSDNGLGIPENLQPRLFSAFFQADDSKSHLGTGIGLALSKSIMELHKGELRVRSVPSADGKPGSTDFTVSLQMGKDHLDGQLLLPEQMNSDNPMHYQMQSEIDTLVETKTVSSSERKYTILVVEDNGEVRAFIRTALSECYFVHESSDGLRGLEDTFNLMPDLVISDVMMPGMDGLEMCRLIKSDERTNHIPVIMLTARATFIHQVNGLENGADAYITKPFSIHVLELHIRNILESKEIIRKKFSREIILQPRNISITSPEEKFLQKLMDIVERNVENDEFGVQELVDEIGMSKTVLYKKVQSLTGLAVADYIKSVRLQTAAMLLKQNKTGIAEVAFAVGFNDRKYFSKEFRKQYGVSPTEYISQHAADTVNE